MPVSITTEPDGRCAIRGEDGTRLGPLYETQDEAIQIAAALYGYLPPCDLPRAAADSRHAEIRRLGRRMADIAAERGACTFRDLQEEGWDIERIGELSEAATAEAARIKALRAKGGRAKGRREGRAA